MDNQRELGRLQRYTDLMRGDCKNALHVARQLNKEFKHDALSTIIVDFGYIEDYLTTIQENLKLCAIQQEK